MKLNNFDIYEIRQLIDAGVSDDNIAALINLRHQLFSVQRTAHQLLSTLALSSNLYLKQWAKDTFNY